jgi:hypothetical protein
MKVYQMTVQIAAVTALIRERASAGTHVPGYDFWRAMNEFGWPLDDGTRVLLEPVELAWALDLAFPDGMLPPDAR